MDKEVADLKRTLEGLEKQVSWFEHRLNLSQIHLEIVTGWRQAEREAGSRPGSMGHEGGFDTADPHFARVESMLRLVLEHQGDQAADIRRVLRSLHLVGREVS
jgi:hypothetical protein